jgi:amidase
MTTADTPSLHADAIVGLTATEMARLVRTRALSPVEVMQAHLATIERLEPQINAVCTLAAEQALDLARAAEQAVMRGDELPSLHGLPLGIKDITLTRGLRTTFGSRLFEHHVPEEDAEVVARLRRAGGIVLCKTNTPEFAAGAATFNDLFGRTRNPWDLTRSPAGSSGGSAAAVASGMLPLAHGTDYGGSVRVPAAFCGIVGIRSTPGLIPNHPMPLAWDPGQVHGPLARTVDDVALMLDAMVGYTRLSPISMPPPWGRCLEAMARIPDCKGLRVAYAADIAGIGVDPEVESICRAMARSLAGDGAQVTELEFDISEGRDAYLALRGEWMVGQQFARLDRIETFGANLAGNVRAGLTLGVRDTAAAETTRNAVWHRMARLFEDFDFLITPTAPVSPFPVEKNFVDEVAGRRLATYIDWIAPTFLITLVGLPAASVPAGLTAAGLPVGAQVIGPRFSEPGILALCKRVEAARPIGRPPVR